MLEVIIPASITGVVTLTVCMISNATQRRNAERQHRATIEAAEKQHNTTIALIEYKLDQLSHKVELHNNAVERLYIAEKHLEVMAEKINVANHRIDDLERVTHHD